MLNLTSQQRNKDEKLSLMRSSGAIPAVLYGPKNKPVSLKVDGKEFQKVYREAGESSLINLEANGAASPVLVREVQRDPLKGGVIHVDFYMPPLDKEIEIMVPLVFEGEAPAVKDLGGTFIRNIQEIEVRALPQNLPHEITVDITGLATFEDKITVSDLVVDSNVEILREKEDAVAQAVPAEDVESELQKPVEEDVESVESTKPEGAEKGSAEAEKDAGEKKEEKS